MTIIVYLGLNVAISAVALNHVHNSTRNDMQWHRLNYAHSSGLAISRVPYFIGGNFGSTPLTHLL